jgi:hypothetical protein
MRAEWNRIALETSFLRGDPTNDKAVDGLRKFSLRPLHGILKRAERIRQTGFDFGKCRFKSVVRISRDQQLVVARRCACTLETFWHPFTGLHLVTLKWSTIVFESLQQVLRNLMLVLVGDIHFLAKHNTTWTIVYTTTNGPGSINDLAALGSGRYVQMYGTIHGTGYGYSLYEFEVYPALPPTPAIAQAGTNAVISWPASVTSWLLQETPVLGPTNLWTTVTNSPFLTNSLNNVTVPIGAGVQFYRLTQNP